jgi:integrase
MAAYMSLSILLFFRYPIVPARFLHTLGVMEAHKGPFAPFRFSLNGKTGKLTIGPYPAIGLSEARKAATEARGLVDRGIDPASTKRASIAALRPAMASDPNAFETVAKNFIAKHVATFSQSHAYNAKAYLARAVDHWKGRRIASITRRDVREFLEGINGKIMPNRVHSVLSKLFAWSIARDIIEANPCTGIEKAKETSRERVLNNQELIAVWRASEPLGDYGRVVRLLILTGARRSEVSNLVWPEIEGDLWKLPRERTKNRVPINLPLSTTALAILGERGVGRVFRAIRFADMKRRLDASAELTTPFVLHDLRRSVASGLGDIGIAPHIIEKILNHVTRGVQGTYQRQTYAPEMRAALDRWGEHIERLIGEGDGATLSNVVSLRS